MDELKELISIITKQKIKGIMIIGKPSSQQSKTYQLYEGIQSGIFANEAEASLSLYKNKDTRQLNFTKLKSRLKKRLINTIFFIDTNQAIYNDAQKAYYNCYKDWAAVKILLGKGARNTSIGIAERIIQKAQKFEFTHLVLDIAKTLRYHYAIIDRNKRKFDTYNKLVKQYQKIFNAELLAEEYYEIISGHFIFSKTADPKMEQLAIHYSEQLKEATKNLSSYRLDLFARMVYVFRYEVINDYQNIIKECNKAIRFFESQSHQASKVATFTFLFKMLACHIQLKQFKEGEKVAKRCMSDMPEGSPNWFHSYELYFTLSLHTKKFQEAYNIFSKVSKHKNFERLYAKSTENWKIYEAYINYFISNKEIKLPTKEKYQKFRLNKFLNELPVYSKDKRGKNIPILVIHILFLLQQQKYGAVIERVEAVNQYTYRYLRNDDTFRSNCFIKMLVQLPKANFHRQAVVRKTAKYFEKLKNKPLEISGQSDEIEIVPYEILWDFVLNSLDNKFH